MEAEANRTMLLWSCLSLSWERGQPNFGQLSFGSELRNSPSYNSVNDRDTLTSLLEDHGVTHPYADLAPICFASLLCSPNFPHVHWHLPAAQWAGSEQKTHPASKRVVSHQFSSSTRSLMRVRQMSVLTQGKARKRSKPLIWADLMRFAASSSFTDKFCLYINL